MRNLKRVLSLALALVMVLGMMVITTSAADFTDADEITYTEAMDVMAGLGLFKGDNNNAVNPHGILTREEAAVLMARIMLGEKTADKLVATKQIFADVPANDWAAKYIEYCYNTGLIGGYTVNGELVFNPDGNLTGVAFAKLLLCAMGYDAAAQGYGGSNWASAIAVDALEAGLTIDGVVISADLTREQAAQMILQALDGDMKTYTTAYDYATGAAILIGPKAVDGVASKDYDKRNNKTDDTLQFAEKYFSGLTKNYASNDDWGRPADYCWKYKTNTTKTLYTAWETPVAVYTEAIAECDIAEELGVKKTADIAVATWNGQDVLLNNMEINATATKVKIGAQGTLVEIYENEDGDYEFVLLDQYLAKVTDVTEVEYDRNGHIEENAELDLLIYAYATDDAKDGDEVTLEDDEDWTYSKNDMLLVYYNEETEDVEIVAYAESIEGAQTARTNDPVHIVEDEEYADAVQLNLDQAGRQTTDHVWYFDTYGNLVGIMDPKDAAASFGTITSIYWRDSNDGENGYAYATITYMDGTSDKAKIYSIDDVVLEGVEGKYADYEDGFVSSTKQYNDTYKVYDEDLEEKVDYTDADYSNVALYAITEGRKGLILETVEDTLENVDIEAGVPDLGEINAGKSTMFLVWNAADEEYETYTGIRNVPDYEDADGFYYTERNDGVADYVFLIDPEGAANDSSVLYYYNGRLNIREYLDDNDVEYWTVKGGYVNGTEGTLTIEDEDVLEDIEDNKGVLVKLTVNKYDVVTAVEPVDEEGTSVRINGKTHYAVYAGAVDNDTGATTADDAELVDSVLMPATGGSYDVEDLTADDVITYNLDLEDTIDEDNAAYLYIVYTKNNSNTKLMTAVTVYITDVPGAASEDLDADLVIYNADDLVDFADDVNAGDDFAGKTVMLAADIDLGGVEWEPINGFRGTFDGNGYTISDLTVYGTTNVGLFGSIVGTVKNVTVTDAEVEGTHWVGVIVGYAYGTIDNCAVIDSTVVCEDDSDEPEDGDKAGAIVGYICGEPQSYLTNCYAEDVTITANRDAGIIAGMVNGTVTVSDNDWDDVVVEWNGYETGANIGGEIGRQ